MEFACTGCGSCCKRIGQFKDKFKALNFPYDVNDKGWCTMLDEKTNQCKVYDNRPDICSVKKTYHTFFEQSGLTEKEYYQLNVKMCNGYIKEDKLDDKYLIDEKIYV